MKLPDVNAMYADMAKKARLRGRLECETCGRSLPLTEEDSARYLSRGWPTCCGLTMSMETTP